MSTVTEMSYDEMKQYLVAASGMIGGDITVAMDIAQKISEDDLRKELLVYEAAGAKSDWSEASDTLQRIARIALTGSPKPILPLDS